MSEITVDHRQPVLADELPGSIARDIALVVAGALFTALLAQISINVPGSPVPITGQTLAVGLVGASLGMTRGAASLALDAVLGLFRPFYADGASGVGVEGQEEAQYRIEGQRRGARRIAFGQPVTPSATGDNPCPRSPSTTASQ
ncbi:MAG: biotin transporter BioY, partial [Solirubrobacterales bacterium]